MSTGVCGAVGAFLLTDPNATDTEKVALGGVTAVVGFFALLGALFLVSFAQTSRRQRDEARQEVQKLDADLHPEFPRHAIKTGRVWHHSLPARPWRGGEGEERVLAIPFNFTNRDMTRRLSLEFEVVWTRTVMDQRLEGFSLHPWIPPEDALPSTLRLPVVVEPQSSTPAGGLLLFESEFATGFDFGEEGDVTPHDGFALILRVTDQVTGATLDEPVRTDYSV